MLQYAGNKLKSPFVDTITNKRTIFFFSYPTYFKKLLHYLYLKIWLFLDQ